MKVMVIGAGKLGTMLATALLNGEIHVTIMDQNEEILNRLKDHMDVMTITANGARKEILEQANIHTYDLAIAVTGSDETNILIGSMVKKLGCKSCVARIRNPEYANQMDFVKEVYDIDHITNPELATADEIYRYLVENYTFYQGDYAEGKISLVTFNIGKSENYVNYSIGQLYNKLNSLLIVAISRDGEIIIPNGSTILEENDIIYVMGNKENIEFIADQLQTTSRKPVKKVMILGGGRIGFYLANRLARKNISIKLVENDINRCRELADQLHERALVIHGDGMDVNLLEEEDLEEMDAFIGCTGFDEENLFMSLQAKKLGIGKVIAKISRQNYVNVIEKLGIDVAINPVNISASDILKYIRGGRVLSVSLLLDGQAEVTEIIASNKLKILNRPIKTLNLPKGIIIGAIMQKDGKAIIPNGDTKIKEGDRIVVFSLISEVPALEAFFHLKEGLR